MTLSPLAEQVYQALLRQLDLPEPLISYGDLVRKLEPLPPPNANLQPNDERLLKALDEIFDGCRSHRPPLPALNSLIVQRTPDGRLGAPGGGYFAMVFPGVWDEPKRLELWRNEVKKVVRCPFPPKLNAEFGSGRTLPRKVQPKLKASMESDRMLAGQTPRWLREPAVIAAIVTAVGSLLVVVVQALISSPGAKPPEPASANSPQPPKVIQAKLVEKNSPPPARSDPPEPAQPNPPPKKGVTGKWSLDDILDALERHHQRATFGAVAGILGVEPLWLFKGRARTAKTSWIVSKATGLPTGTREEDYPAGLLDNERVINSPDDLRAWLRDHH